MIPEMAPMALKTTTLKTINMAPRMIAFLEKITTGLIAMMAFR
jgi:hypothetical protein